VVVGGSAGSHRALLSLVAGLPADLPAAVLVVIHVGAQASSRLPRILSRQGRLPAAHATDGAPLRDGEILVAPPGFHLMVEDKSVRLDRGPRVNRVRPAVDMLFESAARNYGAQVTAVVLSGTMDDGAVGAALVSLAGGQVLVEDPDQAPHGSMPRAALNAAPGAMVIPATELGAAVVRAVGRLTAEPGMEPAGDQLGSAVMADVSDPGFLAEDETRLTRLACPDCGGTLAEIVLPLISYYRCHVGHQFGPQSLVAAQTDAAEAKLWGAVAVLEETAALARHLAEHTTPGGDADHQASTADWAATLAESLRAQIRETPGR
jgi:two-component system chemotaxis response regulator CheB